MQPVVTAECLSKAMNGTRRECRRPEGHYYRLNSLKFTKVKEQLAAVCIVLERDSEFGPKRCFNTD